MTKTSNASLSVRWFTTTNMFPLPAIPVHRHTRSITVCSRRTRSSPRSSKPTCTHKIHDRASQHRFAGCPRTTQHNTARPQATSYFKKKSNPIDTAVLRTCPTMIGSPQPDTARQPLTCNTPFTGAIPCGKNSSGLSVDNCEYPRASFDAKSSLTKNSRLSVASPPTACDGQWSAPFSQNASGSHILITLPHA